MTAPAAADEPLRICLWAPVPPPLGGIARWAQRFCEAAPRYGIDASVVNIAPPVGTTTERSRLDLGRIPIATRAFRDLHRVLRDDEVDQLAGSLDEEIGSQGMEALSDGIDGHFMLLVVSTIRPRC